MTGGAIPVKKDASIDWQEKYYQESLGNVKDDIKEIKTSLKELKNSIEDNRKAIEKLNDKINENLWKTLVGVSIILGIVTFFSRN